jgi:hypothetical protein
MSVASLASRARPQRPLVVAIASSSLLALFATGCSRSAPDATPDGAVRVWLDRMEESDDDPRAIRDAYGLLGPAAHANLEERAARASRLEGHRVEPWEMLAEGRFGLKFRPKAMVAKIEGETASVFVTGDEPLTEHALVHCARASGTSVAWRVEPDLPPVPPLPQREPDPARPKDEGR